MSKIYTRAGDKGLTRLGDGSKVSKDHARVEAYGTVDELNSILGILLTYNLPSQISSALTSIQHDLFDLGGELCIPTHEILKQSKVTWMENVLDGLNAELEPLKEFILPGGTRPAAIAHMARTVCRRAERATVHLSQNEPVNQVGIRYLNRLSDLLFVMARSINRAEQIPDVLWDRNRSSQE